MCQPDWFTSLGYFTKLISEILSEKQIQEAGGKRNNFFCGLWAGEIEQVFPSPPQKKSTTVNWK